MSYSGEAADQVVRLSLNGVEVAAKLSGSAAKQLAIMIYAILKDQKKTKGKIRLTNMLRSGKELKVFAVKDGDLQKFCEEAKKYGVLYCVLKDKNATDGITDIMVRAEDAAKVNRIFTRFGLATVNLASLKTELVKEQNKARTEEDADVRSGSDKPHNDDFVKELFSEDQENHIVEENPPTGRTEAERPSESTSLNRWGEEIFLDNPPSVRETMQRIRQERAAHQPQNTIADKVVKKLRKERNDEMNEIFDKEEWANRKQQDREAAYAMVDDALKKMGTDGKAFQTYLDVQSKFERYSVSNALLVAAQKPEATDLGDANFWRGRGGYIRKGESGILLMEPGNSYTRRDGSKGVNIHIKRVFDISQTTLTPTKQPTVNQDTRLLLNAMVRYAPCKVDFRDELPDGQSALYSPQEKTVFVRRGQTMEDVFRGVAQELAHAYLDTGNYSRDGNTFIAQCVGNILCQRNGIDGKSLAVTQLPQKYAEMEPKQLREELKSIRTAANQISADMFRFLDAKSHGSKQRDDAR